MPRHKKTEDDVKKQQEIAQRWIDFRRDNGLTQKWLAEILGLGHEGSNRRGIRTIQMIERGSVIPQSKTTQRFEALVAKYKAAKEA